MDYAYVRRTVDEIEQGNKQILRLPEGAEKGRIAGGRRTLETSVILGIAKEADREKPCKHEIKEKQEFLLEIYAKHEGIWFDYENDIEQKWEGVEGRGGQEAEVYKGMNFSLWKVVDYYQNSDNPLEFLDNRVAIHNLLFPDTKYELIGFSKKKDRFQFIITQPFIEGRNYRKDDHFPDYMESLGYEQIDDTTYYNKFFIIRDLHEANVIKTQKGFAFVDTIPALLDKTAYRNFQIIDK
jgi:hypothetical protein